jgi:hypothetical protein
MFSDKRVDGHAHADQPSQLRANGGYLSLEHFIHQFVDIGDLDHRPCAPAAPATFNVGEARRDVDTIIGGRLGVASGF